MSFLSNYSDGQRNFGLLLLRIGIGGLFIFYGYPKLIGGIKMWEEIGKAMHHIGVDYVPVVWGFMAAITEVAGGVLLILGIMFRPVCFLMLFVMFVAAMHHFANGDGLAGASHAIEAGITFLSLLFIGPGEYRLKKLVIE